MASLSWPTKDPNEVLDYLINWAARMVTGDTIFSAVFTVVVGTASVQSSSFNAVASTATVWLMGGADGEEVDVQCRIVTVQGRTMDQTVKMKIKTK